MLNKNSREKKQAQELDMLSVCRIGKTARYSVKSIFIVVLHSELCHFSFCTSTAYTNDST